MSEENRKAITEKYIDYLKQKFDFVESAFSNSKSEAYDDTWKDDFEGSVLQTRILIKVGKVVNGKMKYGIIRNKLFKIKRYYNFKVGSKQEEFNVPCIFNSIEKDGYNILKNLKTLTKV